MKRNRNVDVLRAAAIICIIVYHCYVLSGRPWNAHLRLDLILGFGGEIGVTLFLLLSGYGIYCSCAYEDESGKALSWKSFMKKRCTRVMPQYYTCITILLLFCSTYLISKSGIGHVISYYTFCENLFPSTHASVNGALWTMGLIFQYYLVALFLYKAMKKHPIIVGLGSIVFTVLCKYILYHLVLKPIGAEVTYYFVYGRQLFTALDNFVLGMAAALICKKVGVSDTRKKIAGIALIIIAIGLTFIWIFYFGNHGLYGDNVFSYIAHTLLALLLFLVIIGMSTTWQMSVGLFKPFGFIAKNQYGIYLWHMPIIMNLQANSEFFNMMSKNQFILFVICMLLITVIAGYCSTKWIDYARVNVKK